MDDKSNIEGRFWAAARKMAVRQDAPPFFEKRVMAALKLKSQPDPITLATRLLWRAAMSSVGVMIMTAALTWYVDRAGLDRDIAADDIEATMLQALDSEGDTW